MNEWRVNTREGLPSESSPKVGQIRLFGLFLEIPCLKAFYHIHVYTKIQHTQRAFSPFCALLWREHKELTLEDAPLSYLLLSKDNASTFLTFVARERKGNGSHEEHL